MSFTRIALETHITHMRMGVKFYWLPGIVIYEPSAGRRCSRMSAFFKARATKERVPLINARMSRRCLHASGSSNIFCMNIKLKMFVLIH
jgi:hypothetical protein